MTSYTYSPIPYGGGTMNISSNTVSWTHLSGNRFLVLYQQKNPNYILAQVVTWTGPTTAPTYGPARIVWSFPEDFPVMGVYGFGNDALIIYSIWLNNPVAQVLTINETTNEITEHTITSLSAIGVNSYIAFDAGIMTCEKSNNSVMCAYRPSTGTMEVKNAYLTVNPITKEISASIKTYDSTWRFGNLDGYEKVPNETTHIETVSVMKNPGNWTYAKFCYHVGETGDLIHTYNASTWLNSAVYPISSTRFFQIQGGSLYFINNGVFNNTPLVFSSYSVSGSVISVIPLTNSQYMILSSTGNVMIFSISGGVAAATNIANGKMLNLGSVSNLSFPSGKKYHKIDESTYLIWFISGTGSAARLGMKTITM